jgi:hypothetical protein
MINTYYCLIYKTVGNAANKSGADCFPVLTHYVLERVSFVKAPISKAYITCVHVYFTLQILP